MTINRHLILAVLMALFPALQTADAQHSSNENAHTSPYRTSWVLDGALLGVSVAGLAAATEMETEGVTFTEEQLAGLHRRDVPWYDRAATYWYSQTLIDRSNTVGNVLLYAPLALMLDGQMRRDWQTIGLMYVQTNLLASAASSIVKEVVPRHRPYLYNSDLSYDLKTERESGKAFFSSASAYAFSQAVFISTVFSDHHPESPLKPFVWGATLTVASATAALRYTSGIHYLSDVVVGALVGSAIGYAVPRLHRRGNSGTSVMPAAHSGGVGVYAHITF